MRPGGSPASRCVPSNRIVIVPVAEIVRLEAEDNYVRIWADRPYLHKETLTGLMQRLNPPSFLRIHRSHAVNIRLVRELRPQLHGEYVIALADGTELTSGRSYRNRIQGRSDCRAPPNPDRACPAAGPGPGDETCLSIR